MPRDLPIRSNCVSVITLRLLDSGPQYLILRRTSDYLNGEWCHVAGGIETGEAAWQTALRELHEETGLTPLRLYTADRFEQFYRADWDTLVLVPLFVAYVDPTTDVRLNGEHSEYRWCGTAETLALLPFYNQRTNIHHVQAEFIERPPNELLRIAI